MNRLLMTYGIPVLVTAIIFCAYFLIGRIRRKMRVQSGTSEEPAAQTESQVPEVHYDPAPVRLYDSTNRKVYNSFLQDNEIKETLKSWHSLGRKWNHDGKWVYAVNIYQVPGVTDTKYRPVEALMSRTRDNPPSMVHMALSQDAVSVYFDVSDKKSTIQKLMPLLIFAGAMIFVMFMWSQS